MKAAQIDRYGDASEIVVRDVQTPVPTDQQVLVEVHASSINPIDTMLRSGVAQQNMPLQFPATLGGDFAGIITQIGAEVTDLRVGDAVYGQANAAFGNGGALAEYTVTAATQVAKAPTSVDLVHAAALPLVGASAVQGLYEHLHLKAGQRVFITGGTGGIGSLAIQIAKHLGAYVATTATGDGIAFATQLGADEVYDYKAQNFSQLPRSFDALFNTIRGDLVDDFLGLVNPGGIAVSMTGQPNEARAKELNITALAQMTHVTTAVLTTLAQLVDDGVVKPVVEQVFSLDDTAKAFTAKETGKVEGKVVVQIHA